jgi:Heat induced stress protein YflT
MAVAPNNLKDNSSSENNRVVAFFSHRNDAYQALSSLKNAGFDVNAIGLAVGKDQEDTSASSSNSTMGKDDTSFWQKVKDFFSGENDESEHNPGFHDATGGMGWSNDRSSYYREGISGGGAV